MDIKIQEHITFSDLTANPGTLLVVPEVEIHQGRPDRSILAGICQPDADGPGLARYAMIDFHGGWKSWCLAVEYAIQRATSYQPDTLPKLVTQLETLLGATVPPIKVIEPGIGIYSAQTRYPSDNPWQLKDGGFYTVIDPKRGRHTIIADVRNGVTRISFASADLRTVSETFDPAVVLSAAEWKSLTPLPEKP